MQQAIYGRIAAMLFLGILGGLLGLCVSLCLSLNIVWSTAGGAGVFAVMGLVLGVRAVEPMKKLAAFVYDDVS